MNNTNEEEQDLQIQSEENKDEPQNQKEYLKKLQELMKNYNKDVGLTSLDDIPTP